MTKVSAVRCSCCHDLFDAIHPRYFRTTLCLACGTEYQAIKNSRHSTYGIIDFLESKNVVMPKNKFVRFLFDNGVTNFSPLVNSVPAILKGKTPKWCREFNEFYPGFNLTIGRTRIMFNDILAFYSVEYLAAVTPMSD